MTISSKVFVITGAVIEFTINITHSVQISDIANPIIDFLKFTTVSSIVVTHLDKVVGVTMTISNPMVIWTTVLAIKAADFIKVDKITIAIVNQCIIFTIRKGFPEKQTFNIQNAHLVGRTRLEG